MPTAPSSLAAKFFKTLQSCESMPADKLATYQMKLLAMTVRHARDHVEKQRLRLSPVFDSADQLVLEKFQALPVMTKPEMKAGGQDWFAHDTPDHLKPLAWSATSGTTGEPFLIAKTTLAEMVSALLNERQSMWHGLDRSRTHGIIRHFPKGEGGYPDGIRGQGWSLFDNSGALLQVSVHTRPDLLLEWIRTNEVRYLTTYPSVAAGLANLSSGNVLDAVLTFGEPLSPEQREQISAAFSCPVIDAYTANETGFIAIDCPSGEGYHIQSETIYVEIVGDDGYPVGKGQGGSVVVTPFYNTVMPLIRYELGDYAENLEGPCPCGRTSPRLKSIVGRGRQLFLFPDGSRRWPNIDMGELSKLMALHQFQVVQTAPDSLDFRFIAKDPSAGFDADMVTDLICRELYQGLTINFIAVDDVERTDAGKFERFVSRI